MNFYCHFKNFETEIETMNLNELKYNFGTHN